MKKQNKKQKNSKKQIRMNNIHHPKDLHKEIKKLWIL